MTRAVLVVVAVLLALLALRAMRSGWRTRTTRTEALGVAPAAVPADLGAARTAAAEATYVGTTTQGRWLDRVTAHGLGVRSPATVQVHDAGVLVERRGAPDLFLPADRLLVVTTGPGLAGKVVGREGLVLLDWRAADGPDAAALTTGLRLRRRADHDAVLAAAAALVGGPPPPTSPP
uniref:PH-like domain-containing protein n=1 Tax=Cellulomonas endophytica TaxID=2494735 RepID=UPI001012A9E6